MKGLYRNIAVLSLVVSVMTGCGSAYKGIPESGVGTQSGAVAVNAKTGTTTKKLTIEVKDSSSGETKATATAPAGTVMKDATTGNPVTKSVVIDVNLESKEVANVAALPNEVLVSSVDTATQTDVTSAAKVVETGADVKSDSNISITVATPKLAVDSGKKLKRAYLLTGSSVTRSLKRDIQLIGIGTDGTIQFNILIGSPYRIIWIWILNPRVTGGSN